MADKRAIAKERQMSFIHTKEHLPTNVATLMVFPKQFIFGTPQVHSESGAIADPTIRIVRTAKEAQSLFNTDFTNSHQGSLSKHKKPILPLTFVG